ncbi:MAG: HlyC/CorC family transporter [Phycisphaeraceae bacterium]|nr:HlyC/CorC family transporter [Phycisphaeraceae bacterium]
MSALVWFAVAAAALVLAGLFATLHMAIRQASLSRVEELAEERANPAMIRKIDALVRDADGHALAAAFPRVFFTFLFMISVVAWIAQVRHAGDPSSTDVILGVLVSSILAWVFAVALPVSVAEHAAERTIVRFCGLIRLLFIVMAPLRRVGAFFDEVVRRLVGDAERDSAEMLQDEVLSVVEEGEREGQIDEQARHMIESVMQFGWRTVEEIMTPRTEVDALEYTDDLAAVQSFVRDVGHSRIPVYRDDLDHVVGFLYAKDLLRWMSNPEGVDPAAFSLASILRPATFVPETKTVQELLKELLGHRVHIAVAADEYGGTAGIVTMEDIIEEVFGEIQDEYEAPSERPSVDIDRDQMRAELDARTRIDEANDLLDAIGITLPESEDYDTLAGLVIVKLGFIPEPGATVEIDGAILKVLEAEQTRVKRVEVHRMQDREGEGTRAVVAEDGPA